MKREFEIYDLRISVDSILGRSVCGLQVRDYFEVVESSKLKIPDGKFFCIYALSAVIPLIPAKQRQLDENDWLEKDVFVACPDPDERVILRIERINLRKMNSGDLT